MKTMKSLVLGSAAALVAMSGAQAADLPVKAKAVEYVKVCSLYGAGFYYIPGTDTCIKLGGYLRVDLLVNSNSDNTGNVSPQGGSKNRLTNGYTWRSREDFNTDTRTQTEYGVLRTYADFTFSWTSDSYNANANGTTVYAPLNITSGTNPNFIASLPNNAGTGNGSAGTLGVYFAFIQFAGFTIGKAISQFSMPWVKLPGEQLRRSRRRWRHRHRCQPVHLHLGLRRRQYVRSVGAGSGRLSCGGQQQPRRPRRRCYSRGSGHRWLWCR